jgi:TatD DNase family protein
MFIDVHCHLELLKDVNGVVARANDKGVGIIVANGESYESNRKVLDYVEKYDSVRAALGVYPIEALKMSSKGLDEEIDFIGENSDKVVAIGEVGMDFKMSDEKKKQEEIFIKFIRLAKVMNIPLIVHSREAEKECVEILEREMAKKVVMHCFCGGIDLAKRIVENGWSLSIPANVVFANQFQEIVREVGIGSLLCETDSPYLHPVRGKRNNEPGNVVKSYEKIAEIKGINIREVEVKIEENFKKIFS